jgi:alanyl-tRNA synthetase
VLEVGNSIELCGGTHVRAAGDIGTIKVVAESSIGSNLRRVEATTGFNTVRLLQRETSQVAEVARLVGAPADELVSGVQRRLDEIKALQEELKALRARLSAGRAEELAAGAAGGVLVTRVDGLAPGDLRDLAVAVRQRGVGIVVLGGLSDTGGVSLVAAVTSDSGRVAGDLIRDAAKAVGGGGGGKGDIATAGGKNPDGLDEALRIAEAAARS